jgi:hypothetical protein
MEGMKTSASIRSAKRTLNLIVLLLCLGSLGVADTWSRTNEINFSGAPSTGAQLAVAEVMFLPDGGQEARTLLIAVTAGDDEVKLYSYDTGFNTLELEDDITVSVTGINDPIAWTPAFMSLDIEGTGKESCLVIPTLTDGTTGGSISIVRLTVRDNNDLEVLNNCFKCDLGNNWSVYHVTELPGATSYAISTELGEDPPPDPIENTIVIASFSSSLDKLTIHPRLLYPTSIMVHGTLHHGQDLG